MGLPAEELPQGESPGSIYWNFSRSLVLCESESQVFGVGTEAVTGEELTVRPP